MALSYQSFGNTPCAIIRGFYSDAADGTTRVARVGDVGTPLPAGWLPDAGNADNPIFFAKLKNAARRLTGAPNDAALSGADIPGIFFMMAAPQTAAQTALASSFPDGLLLDAPFFESISDLIASEGGVIAGRANLDDIIFETNPDGPTYADIRFLVPNNANQHNLVIKIFHSLTM
jgi:hypothetical protein